MPGSAPLDLSRYSETTRRALYDLMMRIISPPPLASHPAARVDDAFFPTGPQEDAHIVVVWLFGRWFAAWWDFEADADMPLDRRLEVVRIKADPDAEDGIMLYEV